MRYINLIHVVENSIGCSSCYISFELNFGRKRIFHKGFISLLGETRGRNVFWWGRSRVISISRFESLRRKRQCLFFLLFHPGVANEATSPFGIGWICIDRFFFSSCYTPDARWTTTANKSEEKPELSSEAVKGGKGP